MIDMATTTINTRLALKTDISANWKNSSLVLLKGEPAIEITDSGAFKFKFGDGVKTFSELPYATLSPTEISSLITDGAVQSVSISSGDSNGQIAITVDGTKTNASVKGLGSAAFTNSNAYATASHSHAIANVTGLQTALDGKAASTHTHDDRYYTEAEVNTKLAGKANSSHTHGSGDITSLDASKLTGTISIDRLPAGALERCVIVETDADRLKLTTASVQKGDTVKVTGTGKMYFVIDDTKLTSEDGYTVYTAGSATSVPWSGVTGKPNTFTPSSHTHTKSQITDFPTSMPASDVSAWAKAASKPSYTKAEVGLGNVNNTADADKSVKYATSAGTATNVAGGSANTTSEKYRHVWFSDGATETARAYNDALKYDPKSNTMTVNISGSAASAATASSVAWGNVSGRPSTFAPSSHTHTKSQITDFPTSLPASDVYGWAKASAKPSYSWSEIGSKPSTFTPSSHTHNYLAIYGSRPADINFKTSTNGAGAMFHFVATSSTKTGKPPEDSNVLQMNWDNNGGLDTQFAISNGSSPHSYIRSQNNGTWGNWTTLLDSSNYNNYSPSKTGTGASGTWGINITGSSGSCTGNAATASNASKVNGHTVNSDVPSGAKFTDTNTWRPLGTAANTACAGNDSRLSNSRPASDVYSWAKASSKPSYSWSEITSKPSTFTPASHTHAYIPLSGGTITGSIIRSSGGSWISARNNVAVRGTATGKDSWNPVVGQATPNGYWTIGNLASNDNLAFSYTSNTNYNAGNNSATTVYLPVQEGTIITSATIGSQSVKYATSAGSAGSVAWGNVSGKPSSYTPSSHTHDDRYYTETEINTKLGAKLGAVSANGYYGMARPDGNTSDWIRTTTAGIIPYQSGGAGAGHCGIGTSSWYFSNAYIDTVNCVNASVSGHIDVAGYIQSSNLINTYFEYQSNRGSVDWRFGAATGTGDENFFGFYDAKTGKIPLALDGNFGNIYVGFNVGSYESPTAVGVYLGGQVAGNRAFIYNGDSYQGSIWIQTRLDGSWKWFSLGRACSTALSDIRLKGDIRDTEVEDATKVIESMKIRSFERKDSHKKYKIGFIADELEQLDPNLVDGGGEVDGHPYYKSVNNLQMLAYVVKGMQELNSKVTILEKENKRLKQKLNMCN